MIPPNRMMHRNIWKKRKSIRRWTEIVKKKELKNQSEKELTETVSCVAYKSKKIQEKREHRSQEDGQKYVQGGWDWEKSENRFAIKIAKQPAGQGGWDRSREGALVGHYESKQPAGQGGWDGSREGNQITGGLSKQQNKREGTNRGERQIGQNCREQCTILM